MVMHRYLKYSHYKPLRIGKWVMESEMIMILGHLWVSLHIGHARRSISVLHYRIISGSIHLIMIVYRICWNRGMLLTLRTTILTCEKIKTLAYIQTVCFLSSSGGQSNTRPNPNLKTTDENGVEKYGAAYELKDGSLERAGRGKL